MKTIKELKGRLAIGTRLVLDEFKIGGVPMQHKGLNVPRYVVDTLSAQFCLAPSMDTPSSEWSWMDYPKKSEVLFDEGDKGFSVVTENLLLHYTFL